jgi:hypothetical protein
MIAQLVRDYTGAVDADTGLPAVDRSERLPDARQRRLGEVLRAALIEMTETLQAQGLDPATAHALAASQLYTVLPTSIRAEVSTKITALRTRLGLSIAAINIAPDIAAVEKITL